MNSDNGADPVVETSGLRMRYGSREVLRGVDLQVRRGEVLALLGPNGPLATAGVLAAWAALAYAAAPSVLRRLARRP